MVAKRSLFFSFCAALTVQNVCAQALTHESFVPIDVANMNGNYVLSQTPGASLTNERFPTQYRHYPGGARYFDVLAPEISTLYSQVWWSGLEPVELPSDVVERYAGGKAMAVIGFELDQVRVTPEGEHISVPMNVAYNHHFESSMIGGNAWYEKITLTGPDDPRIHEFGLHKLGHCHSNFNEGSEHWIVRGVEESSTPTSQSFGAANGGEVRKSFHGYAPGFAQVIKSPKKVQITPMQIDTWHRDKMNLTGSPFVAGPLPRSSLAAPGAKYSGLLECPLTTRVRKDVTGGYSTLIGTPCRDSGISTAAECFEAAVKVLGKDAPKVTKTVSDPLRPPGCSMETAANAAVITVFFNELHHTSAAVCGGNLTKRAGSASSLVSLSVSLDLVQKEAMINISGPADVWFGVGFNASAMKDAPWAIIVDGLGDVRERKLADQSAGEELQPSVKVISAFVNHGRRTVILTRPMEGPSADYFSFSANQGVLLPFINAVGSKATLSYHKDKTSGTLVLLPVTAPGATGACLCPEHPAPFGHGQGFLNYQPTNQSGERGRPSRIVFPNNCQPFPRTDLLDQRNPTCDIRTYAGGQVACHHMFSLLDADQEIPWPDQPLKYHLKMRFWYQDYNETYHTNVKRTTWGIASPVEYDVPKCMEGMNGCSRDEDGRWIHTIRGTFTGGGYLVAAHFHCHAPTCKSIKMYKDWNGTHGTVICEERPVYGGTGQVDLPKFDEPGYIFQPPCLWGSKEFGLEPPPYVGSTTLHSVKTSYADDGHHGEMAWQQMLYVDELRKPPRSAAVFV